MKEKILNLFAFHKKLRFAEIEKKLNMRSNKLAYHLKHLIKKGILSKKEESYELAPQTESNLPYLASSAAAIPVILVHIGDSSKAILISRKKRPYQHLLGMPGGRLLPGESIESAAQRIVQEKCNISIKNPKITQFALEHVIKEDKIICSFLLIVIKTKVTNSDLLIPIKKNKSRIIPSDYSLLIKGKSRPFSIPTFLGHED